MHSYCLGDFYLLGYIKAVLLPHVMDLTAVALNEGYEKILTFRGVKCTTCVNRFAFCHGFVCGQNGISTCVGF